MGSHVSLMKWKVSEVFFIISIFAALANEFCERIPEVSYVTFTEVFPDLRLLGIFTEPLLTRDVPCFLLRPTLNPDSIQIPSSYTNLLVTNPAMVDTKIVIFYVCCELIRFICRYCLWVELGQGWYPALVW